VTADSIDALKKILSIINEQQLPYYIIGNGSNLLFADEGYHGIVVKIGRFPDDIRVQDKTLHAGAGVMLSQAARAAYEAGLTGLEFAAGIPGSVGGAVIMNAGAYGGEMKDVLKNVTVVDRMGNEAVLPVEELELSYRHSNLAERGMIVTGAEFLLTEGDKTEIKAQMDELAAKRREKQPLEYPSAGSTFKRPEGYFAGKLIQDAGLKGCMVGGAQVSEKHSGFVINKDHATTADILALIEKVKDTVFEQSGVILEMEVKVVK
jgi:UDP-N-acetylmuramate dehydrogenase